MKVEDNILKVNAVDAMNTAVKLACEYQDYFKHLIKDDKVIAQADIRNLMNMTAGTLVIIAELCALAINYNKRLEALEEGETDA